MPKDTRKVEDRQNIGRKDPQQFGTGVPMPDLNPSAPKIPGPYDAPPQPDRQKKKEKDGH
ncbi:MAG TPA: hypothetical protein VK752_10485 [Bryobacteraceae bacterium]|jgi:hypothetical protein|nr:hypothetical protein [Bryobacteraceae bacterium]